MDPLMVAIILLIVIILTLLYVAIWFFWRRNGFWRPGGARSGLQLGLELTPQDGWHLLNLVLSNRGPVSVW